MRDYALLIILCLAAFWFKLGSLGLIDPDEPFYAMTAREMVETGDWITPQIFGKPQFEKPIFYYWMAAGSFALFGESEFAGRLPTAISATILVLLTYQFGRRLFSRQAGLIAGLFMATGLELGIMGRLMLTDIPMTIFVTAALYCYWLALKNPEKRDLWIFWHLVFGGLSVLTKGPLGSMAILMSTICFTIFAKQPFLLRGRGLWWGLLAYSIIVIPWYAFMVIKYQWAFVDEFIIRDNFLRFIRAEHPANNHPWYYPGVFIVGSIPWLPGIALAARDLFSKVREDHPRLFVKAWFLSNLAFLTAAASKLPSYGFYLFVPMALLIGYSLDVLVTRGFRSTGEKWLVLGSAALQFVVVAIAPAVPVAKQFTPTIVMFAVALFVVLILAWTQRWRLWLGATALSTIVFLVGALTISHDKVDNMVSVRGIANKIKEVRREGEPVMAGKFAVRGIWFYLHEPISVIANNEQPFWAEHPLRIIPDKKELTDFLLETDNKSALIVMRPSEWDKYHSYEGIKNTDLKSWHGDNVFVRATTTKQRKNKDKPVKISAEEEKAPALNWWKRIFHKERH